MPGLVLNRKDIDHTHQIETVLNVYKKDKRTVVEIYDTIVPWKLDAGEPGVTEVEIKNTLNEAEGDLDVRINSRGGEMGASLGIYNALKNYDKGAKSAIVEGYAFSSAGWLPMACENRSIATGGIFMCHNPQMKPPITSLKDIEGVRNQWQAHHKSIVDIFTEATNLTETEVSDMMEAETFLSAKEAVAKGLFQKIHNSKANLATLNYAPPANLPSTFTIPKDVVPSMEPLFLQRKRMLQKVK